jgi:hypothetical protein
MADSTLLENLHIIPEFSELHYFWPMLNPTESNNMRQVIESLNLHRGLVTLCWTSQTCDELSRSFQALSMYIIKLTSNF